MDAQWPATVLAMENKIPFRHACVAYLASVTTAALCGASPSFIGATASQALPSLGFAWLAAFVGGLLPFMLAIQRANKLGTRSWAYFAGSGTLAALAAAVVLVGASALACEDEERSSDVPGLLLLLAASGATGGTACWLALRVQARLDTRVRMS